jgi:phosphoribosylanthranilate isomerase
VTGVLVKVCGLTRPEDVVAAVEAGADLVGFILVPWSPRAVDADAAARLRERVPDGVETVGVFVDEDPDRVAEVQRALGLDRVQLHGSEPPEIVARFGERAIKAYRLPHDGELVGPTVLLDRAFGSEPSDAELAEHWAAARREGERRRVLLAGALTPENVGTAVRAARPWAVDAVRGTEAAPGIKDHDRLRAFCAAAREGAT